MEADNKKKKNQASSCQVKYKNDPEFRAKHLAKMKEKVMCDCGKEISKSNMVTHQKSHIHLKKVGQQNIVKKTDSVEILLDLKTRFRNNKSSFEFDTAMEMIDQVIQNVLREK